MALMSNLSNIARSKGDPRVLETGPSSFGVTDQLSRGLGWFSLGLGLAELAAPGRISEALGMAGRESLLRAYGAREIASGVLTLSVNKEVGLWSRVAGDMVDIATVASAHRAHHSKRGNIEGALVMLLGVMALDMVAALAATQAKRRGNGAGAGAFYKDRSGFPQGLEKARGVAATGLRAAPEGDGGDGDRVG